jgi:flavin reductase (DIM6/NTAB) family NADH-FMN oxidoreductase RutF
MAHVEIDPDAWFGQAALTQEFYTRLTQEGILLGAMGASGTLNPMTIGWALAGSIWGRPMMVVLVRPSRHTYDCLEANPDFTVNVLPADRAEAAAFCGTKSGRDLDKMAECQLTALDSLRIRTPGIAESSIVFECRTVHHNDIQAPTFPPDIVTNYYPEGDFHRVYYGALQAVRAVPSLTTGS